MIATGQELAQRLDAIVTAVDEAGDVVSPIVKTQITAISDELHNRLDLGVDHAVVALVGGTGSGKSSLFNTISGLDVAEVSGIRPTTERATACTWGPSSADRLLDFLGV